MIPELFNLLVRAGAICPHCRQPATAHGEAEAWIACEETAKKESA